MVVPRSGEGETPARPLGLIIGLPALLLCLCLGGRLWSLRGTGPERVLVRSRPEGARILIGGRDSGVLTDGEVTLPPEGGTLTLRKPGYKDETRTVRVAPKDGLLVEVVRAVEHVAGRSQFVRRLSRE